MKYLSQVIIILLVSFLGEVLQSLIPLPIPAAIYGIVLLLLALMTGLLKTEKVSDAANFLISIMPLLFIAPVVNILTYWGLIAPYWLPISVICIVSTILVFAVSGIVTQLLLKKKEGTDHE